MSPNVPSVGATLLVTSGGSLVGQAICEVLEGRRAHLRIVAVNSDVDAPHLTSFDHIDRVSPLTSPNFAGHLLDTLRRERADLILAGRDDDVVALAELAAAGSIEADLLASGALRMARVLRDTAATARWAEHMDLPFAPTIALGFAGNEDALKAFATSTGGPWIVKPARSHGSRDVSLLARVDDLLAAAVRTGFVAQPYLSPVDLSTVDGGGNERPWSFEDQGWEADVQVVLGPKGEIREVATFVTRMRRGRPVATQPYVDAGLGHVARLWAEALSAAAWRGPVNIQVRLAPSGAWLPFEINPRLGGGVTLRTRSGFDEISAVLRAFLGIDLPRFTSR